MTDLQTRVAALRRPRLLVRAARIGARDYDRDRDLTRLIGRATAPSPEAAVRWLIDTERHLEEQRRAGAAAYSVLRHVEILISLMSETRLLPGRAAA